MSRTPPRTGEYCRRGLHDACPHYVGGKLSRAGSEVFLCSCSCHATCPVAGSELVANSFWDTACTCPGAEPLRRRQARLHEEGKLRQAALQRVLTETKAEPASSAAELAAGLRRRLDADPSLHLPPTWIDLWARKEWAARGPQLLRRPRAVGAELRALASGTRSFVHALRVAPPAEAPPGGAERAARNRRDRSAVVAEATLTGAAVVALVAARRSSGPSRALFHFLAGLLVTPPVLAEGMGLVVSTAFRAFRGFSAERSDRPDREERLRRLFEED